MGSPYVDLEAMAVAAVFGLCRVERTPCCLGNRSLACSLLRLTKAMAAMPPKPCAGLIVGKSAKRQVVRMIARYLQDER